MGYYSELAYDTEVCETNEAPSGKGGEAVISGDALSAFGEGDFIPCLLYTSPSPRDA